jgi:hypothetical protein
MITANEFCLVIRIRAVGRQSFSESSLQNEFVGSHKHDPPLYSDATIPAKSSNHSMIENKRQ